VSSLEFHDLSAIDTSDLITDVMPSTTSQAVEEEDLQHLKEILDSAEQAAYNTHQSPLQSHISATPLRKSLSSENIISKVADCILELDTEISCSSSLSGFDADFMNATYASQEEYNRNFHNVNDTMQDELDYGSNCTFSASTKQDEHSFTSSVINTAGFQSPGVSVPELGLPSTASNAVTSQVTSIMDYGASVSSGLSSQSYASVISGAGIETIASTELSLLDTMHTSNSLPVTTNRDLSHLPIMVNTNVTAETFGNFHLPPPAAVEEKLYSPKHLSSPDDNDSLSSQGSSRSRHVDMEPFAITSDMLNADFTASVNARAALEEDSNVKSMHVGETENASQSKELSKDTKVITGGDANSITSTEQPTQGEQAISTCASVASSTA